ncbi:MAG: DUF488 domain-containing protein [Thermoleophilia bacterium]|nr:DUF488 domain-containing protein [Thermoleophilia bacterium]
MITRARFGQLTAMATIYTIGYEGRAQHDVLRLLVEAGVEVLVDVRIRPQSRKPGLSKTSLGLACEAAGIEYLHRRALGTPLEVRADFRAGNLERGREDYRTYLLDDARQDLEWLAVIAGRQRTAILCFEFQPRDCHRRVIAEELAACHKFEVIDL